MMELILTPILGLILISVHLFFTGVCLIAILAIGVPTIVIVSIIYIILIFKTKIRSIYAKNDIKSN